MKPYDFLPPAQVELEDAARFCNDQQDGLGVEFLTEFKVSIDILPKRPETSYPLSPTLRKENMSRFPYAIIYRARPDVTVISRSPVWRAAPDTGPID